MEIQQSIRKFIDDARLNLIQYLKSYDDHLQKLNKQSTCTKLKIVLGLFQQNSMQELDQQLADFNDPSLADTIKLLKQNVHRPIPTQTTAPIIAKPKIQQKPNQPQTHNKDSTKNKTSQPAKRNTSILKSVLGKFIKQQENVREMILPEKEKKRYYDYEKKRYVFEGEEQEEVKQVPKPPPARKINTTQAAPTKQKQKSELDDLMAPPSYKRKGKKNDVQVKQKKVEITLQSLQDRINSQLLQITQRFLTVLEEQRSEWDRKGGNIGQLSTQTEIPSQVLLKINNIENSIIQSRMVAEKLENTLSESMRSFGERNEIERDIVEKLMMIQKQNGQILKLGLNNQSSQKQIKSQNQQKQLYRQFADKQKQVQIMKINKLGEAQDCHHQLDQYKKQNSQLKSQIDTLSAQIKALSQKVYDYQSDVLKFDRDLRSRNQAYTNLEGELREKSALIAELNRGAAQNIAQAHQFEQQLNRKQKELLNLKKDLASKTDQSKKYHAQIVQLKEKVILTEKNIKNQQEEILQKLLYNSSIINSINQALIAENQLYNTIRSKRISLYSQGKQGKNIRWSQPSRNDSRQNSLFQLSDCLTKIVEHYEAQLDRLAKQYAIVQAEYEELKGQGNKVHQNLITQNQTLQRSLNRTKELMQEYKQSKQETERKVSDLENENEGLRRQIIHLRKEQKYTKQLLEKNIRSHHDNTTTIKEQLEAEVKSLEQELEESKERQKMIKNEVIQLQQKMEQLGKQSKSKGIKISQLEKEMKNVKLALQEKQGNLQNVQLRIRQIQREKESEKKRLMEEKSRNESLLKKTKVKIKELEEENLRLESCLKQQKNRVQQLQQKQETITNENKEIMQSLQQAIQENERFKPFIQQLKNKTAALQIEIQDLEKEKASLGTALEELQHKNKCMSEQLTQESQEISSIKNEAKEYKRLYRQQNQQLNSLISYTSVLKEELSMIDREYREKIEGIYSQMSSIQDIQDLRLSINKYQQLIKDLHQKINHLSEQVIHKQNEKQQNEYKRLEHIAELEQQLKKLEEQAKQLKELRKIRENEGRLTQQIQELSEELLSRQSQLNEERDRAKKAQQQKEQIYGITYQMEREINQLKSGIQIERERKDYVENQMKMIQKKYNQMIEQNEGYLLLIKQKQQQIELLSSKIVECQEGQRQKIELDNQKLAMLVEKEKKNDQLANQISILEGQKQKITKFSSSLELEMKKMQENYRQALKSRELQEENRRKEKENEISTLLLNLEQNEEMINKQKSIIDEQARQIKLLNQHLIEIKSNQREKQENLLTIQKEKDQKKTDKSISPKEQLINNVDNAKQLLRAQNEQKQRLVRQLAVKQAEVQKIRLQKQQLDTQIEELLLNFDEKANEVVKKDEIISQLTKQKQEHEGNVGQLLLKLEEAQRQKEELKEKVRKIQYQLQLKRVREDNQQQSESENELHQLAMVQDAKINEQSLEISKLQQKIDRLNKEITSLQNSNKELNRQKNELHQLYVNKSDHAEKTIEGLQQKLRDSRKYSNQIEVLNNKIKDLESEVSILLGDKADLLKRNNEISEILSQRSLKVQISDGTKASVDSPLKNNKKEQNPRPIQSIKKVQSQAQPARPSGFLGSLSSFFLTPTENEKLTKIAK